MRLAFGVLFVLILSLTVSCRKESNLPVVITSEIKEVTQTTAECGGYISSDGGDPVISRGVCWSTEKDPTIDHFITANGSDTGRFVSRLTGLRNGTVYYVRAYANNKYGTGYGEVKSFKSGIIKDIEGNIYNTVLIGKQLWMAENLRTMRYQDGTEIPLVADNSWKTLTTGAVCFLDNDLSYKSSYGGLYNFYAVANSRKICPDGWHVPTISEWDTLVLNLGGKELAGASMKETGTQHWMAPNTGATNLSGFSALPGGVRATTYELAGYVGQWWSSTPSSVDMARGVEILNSSSECKTSISFLKTYGVSVRCIKN